MKYLFSAVCFAFAWFSVWVLLFQQQSAAGDLYVMDAWASLAWTSFPVLLGIFFYHLSQVDFPWIRKLLLFVLLPLAVMIMLRYILDPMSIKTFYQHNGIWFFRVNLLSFWTYLYVAYLMVCGIICFFLLIQWYDLLKTNKEEWQFRIIFGSLGVSFIFSLITNVAFPFVGQQMLPGLAHINFFPLAIGIFYAISSYANRPFSPQVTDLLVSKYLEQFLFFLDVRGQLIETNQYTVSKLRYIEKQALVKAFPSGLFADLAWFKAFFSRSLHHQGAPERTESILLGKDGSRIHAELFSVRMTDRFKRSRGLVIFGNDLGRVYQLRKKLEVQENRLQACLREYEDLKRIIEEREAELQNAREKLHVEMLETERAEQQMRDTLLKQQEFIREIYHRVKNSIQIAVALTNMLGTYEKANVKHKQITGDIAEGIRNIAEIHDMLYGKMDARDSGFRQLIEHTANNCIMGLPQDARPTLTMSLTEVVIPLGQAIPLGVAFREMFSGFIIIFKQLQKTDLSVSSVHIVLKKQDNQLIISVEDKAMIPFEERLTIDAYRIKISFVRALAKEQLCGHLTVLEQAGLMLSLRAPLQYE